MTGAVAGVSGAPHSRRSRANATPWLLVAPAVILYVLLFVIPFGNLVVSSFYDYSRLTGIIKVFTLRNYVRFWTDPFYLDIIVRTFRVSLIATAVTLLIGYPVALYITRASARLRAIVTLLILSPLLGLLCGFFLMILLLWVVLRMRPMVVSRTFRVLQLGSAGLMAFAHGSNDAQKSMGIIAMALVAFTATVNDPPGWVRPLLKPATYQLTAYR